MTLLTSFARLVFFSCLWVVFGLSAMLIAVADIVVVCGIIFVVAWMAQLI